MSALQQTIQAVTGKVARNAGAKPQTVQQQQQANAVANGATSPAVCKQGSRWLVEKGRHAAEAVLVEPQSLNEAVFIEDCQACAVRVSNKINAVTASKCRKLSLTVQSVVSTVELLGCQNMSLHLQGHVPAVILDNCDGVQVYLSAQSRAVELLTSKCSELNVCIDRACLTGSGSADELVEIAVPFQFRTRLDGNGTLVTQAVKHAGA